MCCHINCCCPNMKRSGLINLLFVFTLINFVLSLTAIFIRAAKTGRYEEALIYLEERNNGTFNNFEFENCSLGGLLKDEYYCDIYGKRLKKPERYVNYQARNPSKTTAQVIQAVNSNIDYKFYTNMKSTKTSEGYLMLVNKFYTVGKSYVAKLKSVTGGGSLEPTAAAAFENMVKAAKADGYSLWNVSGYRSYSTQQTLYNNYKARDGQAKADTY